MNWHKNAKKICRFVREYYKPWANAPMRSLRDYFRWYAERDLLGVLWHDNQVIAVGTFRLFNNRVNYRIEFLHNPIGRFCRANLYGAAHPVCIPLLVSKICKSHDPRNKTFLWHRDVEELGPPREYSYTQFTRMLSLLYVRRKRSTTT